MEFEQGAVSSNAAIIATGLAVEPALIRLLMREGKRTGLGECGSSSATAQSMSSLFVMSSPRQRSLTEP